VTNAYVILNPMAGNSDPEAIKKTLRQKLGNANCSHQVYQTTGDESIPDLIRAVLDDGYDLFVAVGGDGTASAVAAGLVHSGKPLALIPTGTGNALAHDLGIPLDSEEAVRLLVGEFTTRTIDVLRINQWFFVLNVSVGISPEVMSDTDGEDKRRLGRLAYVWTGLRKLLGLKSERFELDIEGNRHSLQATEVLILNSGAVGLADAQWMDQVCLDDGRMEVYALQARTMWGLLHLAWSRLLGRQDPNIRHWSAESSVTIRSESSLTVQADGEVIGQTPVEVEMVPGGLSIVVPGKTGG
jgi:YegS/Rv2252/BmrU family lipid kinase